MHEILSRIFEWSYFTYVGIAAAGLILWTVLARKIKNEKKWRTANRILFVIAAAFILSLTLLARSSGIQVLRLSPFNSLDFAREFSDVYKQMAMNVMLFMPIGMTLPFSLKNAKHAIVLTAVVTVVSSVIIEALQYFACRGEAETVDVICNTTGALIGTLPYLYLKRTGKRAGKDGK